MYPHKVATWVNYIENFGLTGLEFQPVPEAFVKEASLDTFQADTIFPSDLPQAFYGQALNFLERNDIDSGIRCLRQAVQLKPDFTAAHYELGLVLLRISQINEAKVELEIVLKLDRNHVGAKKHLNDISKIW